MFHALARSGMLVHPLPPAFWGFPNGMSPCMARGGALPSNRLMGMCRWMGSHFHDWIDYNGVAFSTELLEWDHIFLGFWSKNILVSREFGY